MEYQYGGNIAIFHVKVNDDGSFRGSAIRRRGEGQVQTLEGKVIGNSIEADTESPWCQYHLTLKRE
jgi:hypothetical protein